MSLSRRLFNIARAELAAAIRRLPGVSTERSDPRIDEELERAKAQARADVHAESVVGRRSVRDEEVTVRHWYANLELPLGSSAAEVRAAYRRLMRRYHPDRHQTDPEAARVAHELSQKLRSAHDGLLAHLDARA